MKLKLDDKGAVVVQNDMPVYVYPDGKEVAFDAPAAVSKISGLNAEAKSHREAKEAAEAKLKGFEGIDDAEAARKAIETLKNIDEGKLMQAGKVEEIKSAAKKAAEEQVAAANKANAERLAAVQADRDTLKSQLDNHLIGGAFARSKFISEKFAAQGPAGVEIAQALFANRLKVEDGKVVAYDAAGNKLYSRARPGEVADADEAIELLVDAYPHKAHILKGSNASGGGAQGGGGGSGSKKTITRAAFEALGPAEKAVAAKESTITD